MASTSHSRFSSSSKSQLAGVMPSSPGCRTCHRDFCSETTARSSRFSTPPMSVRRAQVSTVLTTTGAGSPTVDSGPGPNTRIRTNLSPSTAAPAFEWWPPDRRQDGFHIGHYSHGVEPGGVEPGSSRSRFHGGVPVMVVSPSGAVRPRRFSRASSFMTHGTHRRVPRFRGWPPHRTHFPARFRRSLVALLRFARCSRWNSH